MSVYLYTYSAYKKAFKISDKIAFPLLPSSINVKPAIELWKKSPIKKERFQESTLEAFFLFWYNLSDMKNNIREDPKYTEHFL